MSIIKKNTAFQEQILEGIPHKLPAIKAYPENVNRAPKRKDILTKDELPLKSYTICGWVKTIREQKTFAFLEINILSSLLAYQRSFLAFSITVNTITNISIGGNK